MYAWMITSIVYRLPSSDWILVMDYCIKVKTNSRQNFSIFLGYWLLTIRTKFNLSLDRPSKFVVPCSLFLIPL
jgi:hypothetical protein